MHHYSCLLIFLLSVLEYRVLFWCLVIGSALSEQMEIGFGIRVPEENPSWQLPGQIHTHTQGERQPPGMFFNTRSRIKEMEECRLRVPDETNRWPKEETNKDEGGNSRLRPQAGQIQDSVAAGSSLRQGNRANGCRKKMRSVQSTVHPWMYTAGFCRSPSLWGSSSPSPPRTATPVPDKLRGPSIIDQIMPVHTLSSQAPWSFLLFKSFFLNFAHWRDTGSQPPKQANTLQLEKIWRDIKMILKISPCEGPYI